MIEILATFIFLQLAFDVWVGVGMVVNAKAIILLGQYVGIEK